MWVHCILSLNYNPDLIDFSKSDEFFHFINLVLIENVSYLRALNEFNGSFLGFIFGLHMNNFSFDLLNYLDDFPGILIYFPTLFEFRT